MEKTIIINNCIKNVNEINAQDIITYMNNKTPEEKKIFASKVFKNNSSYNHFTARKVFLETYFPQILGRKEPAPLASAEIKSWLFE